MVRGLSARSTDVGTNLARLNGRSTFRTQAGPAPVVLVVNVRSTGTRYRCARDLADRRAQAAAVTSEQKRSEREVELELI
jgi:hypothetical protein